MLAWWLVLAMMLLQVNLKQLALELKDLKQLALELNV
jgi:hypothetical protein